jgi:hypothetical protein
LLTLCPKPPSWVVSHAGDARAERRTGG